MSDYHRAMLGIWLMVGIPAAAYLICLVGFLVTR